MPVELSVAAPVYNEEEGIESIVRYWDGVLEELGIPSEMVLANDGSTDKTEPILRNLESVISRLKVVSYVPNRGYGCALRTAIGATQGEWVVTLDSDGQFDLADVRQLLELRREQGLDFVAGVRSRKKDRILRVAADSGLRWLVRFLFHTPFSDTNCAMKLIRGNFARNLNIEASGYPVPTEITIKLHAIGAKSGEVEIEHKERAAGKSKLAVLTTSFAFFRFLIYLRKKIRLYRAGIIQTL